MLRCPNAAPQDPEEKGRQDSLEHRTPSPNHLCSSMICEADMSWFYFLSVDGRTQDPIPEPSCMDRCEMLFSHKKIDTEDQG